MLTIQHKVGIKALTNCTIKCRRLMPFLTLKKGQRANLPKGTFFVDGGIEFCKPLTFAVPEFPKKEREIVPEKITYTFDYDPSKATNRFTTLKGTINLDPSIMNKPAFCKRFVYLHEIAHYYYTTEEKCDKVAVIMMLKGGYMPKQILKAVNLTLSSISRKNAVKNLLKKV